MRPHGFTLFEMMVVLCIIGVIAGLSLPQYGRSVERTHRKDAENQMILIHSAQSQYSARNSGAYWGPAAGSTPEEKLADINLNLGLNILPNGMQYDCTITNPVPGTFGYSCSATRATGTAYVVAVTESPISTGVNPSCSPVSACP